MDPSNPLYIHLSDGPGSLPIQEKLIGAQNYRSWRRAVEIGLSTKRKLGFVRGTVLRPSVIPVPPTTAAQNAANIELWETCNNLVISWIMSSISESIAKSIMFIDSACEIWIQLETRFSLSNGSRKYKLSKECFEIQQHGDSVSEYYTKLKCVWEELDSMTILPRLMTITPEMSGFLIAVEKQKEEQRLFQFLNGLDECYSAQRSQLLLINPLPSVENACAVIQQEESQKDVFNHGHVPLVETTALYGKQENKGKCGICGFKWHPPERCWEKVGYPVWHHKYKQPQNKSAQFKPKSGVNPGNFKRTAASVTSGATSFTFTPEQFESLMRSVLNDVKNSGTSGNDCTDDELEFVAVYDDPIVFPSTSVESSIPVESPIESVNVSEPTTSVPLRKSSRHTKPPGWTKDFVVPTIKPVANQVTGPETRKDDEYTPSELPMNGSNYSTKLKKRNRS
ncbi:hypothetical protein CTI12_AA171650 [Artemisia annua]|uniref:Retrotransposon Copia-like N-terminal domain-containing protein n=1 Tax=Artemisia annua TaxID=35608 RepID=A0A2U1P901_ARTAN|nr:hypothetical protein CTI12_AA171650 [Artemisia annua]